MKTLLFSALIATLLVPFSRAAAPVVSNIRAAQIAGTKNVEILYDVSDADGGTLTIGVEISGDGGSTYTIPATALSGHVGPGVSPGLNRRIVWNAGFDWNNQYVPNARARVTAYDGTTPVPPAGMVYIPAGAFQMGDNLDGDAGAMPVHTVTLDGFHMERFEVTNELWQSVRTWGAANGYSINSGYVGAGLGHPVGSVTWYDAVKWCNARSEKEGLTPCYYEDDAQMIVYRGGNTDLANSRVKWSANGYRLPTEAEWEKAARGGSFGLRYPWGNAISPNHANFHGSGDPFENRDPPSTPVGYFNGSQVPAGVDMANGYGLYDMAGNAWEWCWDLYGPTYYGDSTAANNPRGPIGGTVYRMLRGGGHGYNTRDVRCAARGTAPPLGAGEYYGFRCVRGL